MYSPMFRVKPVRVRFWGLSQSILCLTVQQADATTYCSFFGAHTAHLAFVKYCLNHNIQKVNLHYLLQIRFIMHFLTCTFPLADCIFVKFLCTVHNIHIFLRNCALTSNDRNFFVSVWPAINTRDMQFYEVNKKIPAIKLLTNLLVKS